MSEVTELTKKDFVSGADVRWCPRCGDYAILSAVQKVFPELGIPREKFVVVSGIGCSSRFPYYMNTYGFHTIHGRAPAIATGVKVANPDLSVWLVTGDGDGLSIGGNHLMHILRRNLDVKILLFNNRIYGLTKGQYSPTSEVGKKTKTSPQGSIDQPINPLCFALAAEATFVARAVDTNPKHMADVFKAAAEHKGVAFIEIFQNCVIFNDGAFEDIAGRDVRDDRQLMLEPGKPLIFGKDRNKGIRLNGLKPEVVTIGENGITEADLIVHNENDPDPTYAYLLTQMKYPDFPTPMGIFRSVEGKAVYEEELQHQLDDAVSKKGAGKLQMLLNGPEFWEVDADNNILGSSNSKMLKDPHEKIAGENVVAELKAYEQKMKTHPIYQVISEPLKLAIDAGYGSSDLVLSSQSSIAEAIEVMKNENVDAILVVDDNRLVGMLTERDIIFKVLFKRVNREKTKIEEIMSKEPEALKRSMSIAYAINKMALGGFRHLPVISNRKNKFGMISIRDLLAYVHDRILQKKTESKA